MRTSAALGTRVAAFLAVLAAVAALGTAAHAPWAAFVHSPVALRGHTAAASRLRAPAVLARARRCGGLQIRASASPNVLPGQQPEEVEVVADDGHKIKMWVKGPKDGRNVVLLHGRTWSARPVWDLQVGDPPRDGASKLGASTMDLMASLGIRTFAPDMRGLGGTERDDPGYTTPHRCVSDVKCVIDYLKEQGVHKPHLVGWSQGGLVAQLYAQKHGEDINGVVLYATIFDADQKYPEEEPPATPPVVMNMMEGAMEDWTCPGLIDDEAAQAFGTDALQWDSRKVSWARLHEFNELDAAKVTIPTLVIHGEKDMYTDFEKQRKLFMDLGTRDKGWRVVAGCDHPVHLYPRERRVWMSALMGFFEGIDAYAD
mmetsp:Transcript_34043/g.83727  ORF Transcript_34043/g.83727 Transcript_34043/m.83727 type:complete len:371 (+) Transcript_34043:46-1158(+)